MSNYNNYNITQNFDISENNKDVEYQIPNFQSTDEMLNYLDYLQTEYNNTGNEIIPDEVFDSLVKYYERISGREFKRIGAKSDEKTEVLPGKMASIDKVKDPKSAKERDILLKFLSLHDTDMVLLNKMDGISLEIQFKVVNGHVDISIWKRGDGDRGPNVSYIKKYLNLPQINFNMLIRGELIVKNDAFNNMNTYLVSKGNKAKNSRSVANAATKADMDPYIISNCTFSPFFIYETDDPNNPGTKLNLKMSEQINFLKSLGFDTSYMTIVSKENKIQLTIDYVQRYFKWRRETENYRLDGIVIYHDIVPPPITENVNPEYALAVKEDSTAITTVIDNVWNMTSKDGYFNPVTLIEPVEVLGSTISAVTGHNARMLVKNGIGPGAIIVVGLGGDAIPEFYSVIKPAIVYGPAIPFEWNPNGVELRVLNPNSYPQVQCCKIKYFLNCLDIKKWGLLTIWKLYNGGYRTIGKIIRTTIEELMTVSGVQYDGAVGLHDELQKALSKVTIPKIMAGSCIFGEGLGEGIADKFITYFPNWRVLTPSYEEILSKKDFGPARAKMFSMCLDLFKDWLDEHPELEGITVEKVKKSAVLQGHVFTFTGFTDNIARETIESYSGKVLDDWRSDVTVVVALNVNSNSKKTNKARESGGRVVLISRNDFNKWLSELQMSV